VAQITAGLKVAIDALSLTGITTTDNTTDLDIDSSSGANNVSFHVEDRTLLAVQDETLDGSPTIATDIAAVQGCHHGGCRLHRDAGQVAHRGESRRGHLRQWIE
jgi:type 1 fimbria pilin